MKNNKKILFGTFLCGVAVLSSIGIRPQLSHNAVALNETKIDDINEQNDYFISNQNLSVSYDVSDSRGTKGAVVTLTDRGLITDRFTLDYKNYIRKSDLANGFLDISFGLGEGGIQEFDYFLVTLTDAINQDSKLVYAFAPQPVSSGWWNAWTATFITLTDNIEPWSTVKYQNNAGLKIKGTEQPLVAYNNSFIGPTNGYYRGTYMDCGYNLGRKTQYFFPSQTGATMDTLSLKFSGNTAYVNGARIADLQDEAYLSMASENLVGTAYESLYSKETLDSLFSSGYCTLSLTFMNVYSSQFSAHIKKIGNQILGSNHINNSTPLFEVENNTNAVVGYDFKIPFVKITDFREGDISNKRSIKFFTINGTEVPYSGNSIQFGNSGSYTMQTKVELTSGESFINEKTIQCFDKMPVTSYSIDSAFEKNYLTGDTIEIPFAIATNDLSTTIDKTVEPVALLQNNGVTVKTFDSKSSNYYTFENEGNYILAYIYKNNYGKVNTKTFSFNVTKSISINPKFMPNCLMSKKENTISDFSPIDFINGRDNSEIYRGIYLDGELIYLAKGNDVISGSLKINKELTAGTSVLEYKAGYSKENLQYSRSFVIPTLAPRYAEDYLVFQQGDSFDRNNFTPVGTKEDIGLKFNEDSKITLPQKLYFNNLSVSFDIKKNYNYLDNLELIITDFNNQFNKIKIKIVPNDDDTTSKIYLNGKYVNDAYGSFNNDTQIFNWVVDPINSRIIDINGFAVTGRISTWSNGNPFLGFEDGSCTLSFQANGVFGDTLFSLRKVNNTPFFTTKIGNIVQKFSDMYSPIIVVEDDVKTKVSSGDYINVPVARAFDVLSPYTFTNVSLTDPLGLEVFSGTPDRVRKFLADQFGNYILNYNSHDGNDLFVSETRFVIGINDTTAPLIYVNGELPSTLPLNTTYTFPTARVFDNVKQDCTYQIFVLAPNGNRQMVVNNSYKFNQKGLYEVQYFTYDDYMNYTMMNFEIIVQ